MAYLIADLRRIQEDANHSDTPNGGLVWDLCAEVIRLRKAADMRPVYRDTTIEEALRAEGTAYRKALEPVLDAWGRGRHAYELHISYLTGDQQQAFRAACRLMGIPLPGEEQKSGGE